MPRPLWHPRAEAVFRGPWRCRILLPFLAMALAVATLGSACAARVSEPPIVILVSIDGWRWDYIERYAPAAITRLARAGVRAEGLVPVFPSKTFPNHYTIVTGLYPGRHGILSNAMVDPALPGRFTLGNREIQQDTRWWGGEPLWVTAERQGQVAATMFWPGSDVEIAGDRPTYWRMYDGSVSNEARVDQLLAWLAEPAATRPTFLTLYFSAVDTAGHDFGPDSAKTAEAAREVDAAIDRLLQGIARQSLDGVVNVILVSDHGMSALARNRVIVVDDYIDVDTVDIIDSSPILGLSPRDGTTTASLLAALQGKHPALDVYSRSTLPPQFRLANHPRLPEVIGIADDGWHVTTRRRLWEEEERGESAGGAHGYDPRHRSMHGLFVAAGPRFRRGAVVPAFENVHLYELMCRILGLTPAANDGDPAVAAGLLTGAGQ